MEAYFEAIRLGVVETYQIDPVIFLIIYFGTTPIYYYGEFLMLKAGYKYYRERRDNVSGPSLINEPGFLKGLLINRLTWLAPYLYLFIYGENISPWIYLLIIFWGSLTSYFFLRKSHKSIISNTVPVRVHKYEKFLSFFSTKFS